MPTYAPTTPTVTGQTVVNQLTPTQIWEATVDKHAENKDFWQKMEGGPGSFIVSKTDLTKDKAGQTLNLRVESGYYNEPHYGDEVFEDETHFEGFDAEDYQLVVDFIRNGAFGSVRSEALSGLDGEILSNMPAKLGDWLGRYRSENLDMLFREKVNTENIFRPNNKASKDTLVKADGLSYNVISTAAAYLSTLGGQEAVAGTYANKAKAMRFCLVAPKSALTVLKQDSGYQSMLASAGVRGAMNPYFSGEFTDLDGVVVMDRNVIDHDGIGAIGSPLNPRARLGTAITAGTAAFDITGGGNATNGALTRKLYFKYFPNYAYKFSSYGSGSGASINTNSILTQDGNTHYVLIYNTTGADAGKFGMYAYTTGNNGNKITVTARLGSAASGIRATTVGNVTWNTGIWSGKHTDAHPSNSLVIPCNANGEPIGWSFLLGHAAAFRGYGKYRNHRASEDVEAGFAKKTYLWSVFGQCLRQTRDGRHSGIITIQHALHYPELPLPTIV